jgi:hypothetical protein
MASPGNGSGSKEEVMAKIDREHLHSMWELMPLEIQDALQAAVEALAAGEGRKTNVLIRLCPRCGGADTTDCHEVAGIDDSTVGLCITCGYVWCLECETHLISTAICGHWKICANCGERKDESGYCGTVPWECDHIKRWLERTNPTA